MDKEDLIDRLHELNPEALRADNFEDALIGIGTQFNMALAVYDWEECVELCIKDGMEYDEAVEYMDFNVTGAYMGKGTPIFLTHKVGE